MSSFVVYSDEFMYFYTKPLYTDPSCLGLWIPSLFLMYFLVCYFSWIKMIEWCISCITFWSIFFFSFFLELPIWNYDGSSTGQATGENSDMFLYPVAMYNDPFLRGNNKLVLCEVTDHKRTPTSKYKHLCFGQYIHLKNEVSLG